MKLTATPSDRMPLLTAGMLSPHMPSTNAKLLRALELVQRNHEFFSIF